MTKHNLKSLFLSMVAFLLPLGFSALAANDFLQFSILVAVEDEEEVLIENAEVSVDAYLPESERRDGKRFARQVKISNSTAPLHFKGRSLGRCIIRVSRDGYFASWLEPKLKVSYPNNRYEPWNRTYSILLKKQENPRPLFVHRVEWLPVPLIDTPIGFDLERADWVSPYGKGLHEDFVVTLTRVLGEGEVYRGEMTVAFSNAKDGVIPVSSTDGASSQLLLGKEAPVDGYQPIYRRVVGVADTDDGLRLIDDPPLDDLQNCEGLWFRVRSEVDEATGELKRARYGKVAGFIDFEVREPESAGHVRFIYYLAPDYSRSVEYNGESLVEGANLQSVTKF